MEKVKSKIRVANRFKESLLPRVLCRQATASDGLKIKFDLSGNMDPCNKGRFCNTVATVALIASQFKAIKDCRQMKFSQPVNQNKHGHKNAVKSVRQTLALCKRKVVLKRSYVLVTKEEG